LDYEQTLSPLEYRAPCSSAPIISSGGDEEVDMGGTASGTTVSRGGFEGIHSGGTAIDTTISGGAEQVFSGGIGGTASGNVKNVSQR
jgi:autotransporter passenger strand-loop-strand repeat protein